MKKILSVFMLGGVALSANAQQINGGFDADWVKCVPWDSKGNTSVSGTEPEGWHASNVNTAIGKKQIINAVEGKDGTVDIYRIEAEDEPGTFFFRICGENDTVPKIEAKIKTIYTDDIRE